jgi:hypothetical protein
MATKKQQVADQTLKGAIVGVVTYVLANGNADPSLQAVVMPAVLAVLAYVSTLIGNKGTANFLDKAVAELPKVVEEVQKAVEKKPAAKKPAAKKPTTVKK